MICLFISSPYKKILNIIITYCFFIIVSCNSNKHSEGNNTIDIWSSAPAKKWQDALISGNGSIGILVLGDPESERIIFNHEECYEFLGTEEITPPNLLPYMPKIKQLLLDGNYKEAAQYSIKKSTKNWKRAWTDPYHPAMEMTIQQDINGQQKDYTRKTNFETGEIQVSWTDDMGSYQRKSFVSRTDEAVVQQISSNAPMNFRIKISDLFELKKANKKFIKGPYRLQEPQLNISSDWITYRVGYTAYPRGYEAVTKVIVNGGKSKVKNEEIIISNASEVLLLTRINFLEDYNLSELKKTKIALNKLGVQYDLLLNRHAKVHGDMFNRVKFDIYDGTKNSNEKLIANQKLNNKSINPEFLESVFNMGRYTLISSSGNLPPNLSGIWQGDFRPDWSGDFTLDANVNMQISSANLGDLKEAIDSYMNLLENIAPDWEINAKQFYGVNGYLSGIRTSGRRNLSTHYSVYGPWHFWTSGAQWLLMPAYEYYLTSGDDKFLNERLLPMMKKVVSFYEEFLTTYDENGKYIFVPSASPENTPNGSNQSTASVNATIDIAAAKEAITNLITVCEELNIEQENIPVWKAMLEKFPPYLLNEKGAIKEWATQKIQDNQAHRHISHLYSVWPGHEINQKETPELFKAAKKAIEIREIGDGSAFGMAHRGLICSRLKMHNDVYNAMLSLLTKDYFYTSLFTSHNPGPRIYNADLINGFPTIIMESLVYSKPSFIELLPAWSPKIAKGRIEGVKCRTNATVNYLEWDFERMTIKASLSSDKNQKLELLCKWGIVDVQSSSNYSQESENSITFDIKKGEIIELEIKLKRQILN